jgi:hypothetical protein
MGFMLKDPGDYVDTQRQLNAYIPFLLPSLRHYMV